MPAGLLNDATPAASEASPVDRLPVSSNGKPRRGRGRPRKDSVAVKDQPAESNAGTETPLDATAAGLSGGYAVPSEGNPVATGGDSGGKDAAASSSQPRVGGRFAKRQDGPGVIEIPVPASGHIDGRPVSKKLDTVAVGEPRRHWSLL